MTLTKEHHEKEKVNRRRLKDEYGRSITRADFFGLLVDQYGDKVKIPPHLLRAWLGED